MVTCIFIWKIQFLESTLIGKFEMYDKSCIPACPLWFNVRTIEGLLGYCSRSHTLFYHPWTIAEVLWDTWLNTCIFLLLYLFKYLLDIDHNTYFLHLFPCQICLSPRTREDLALLYSWMTCHQCYLHGPDLKSGVTSSTLYPPGSKNLTAP